MCRTPSVAWEARIRALSIAGTIDVNLQEELGERFDLTRETGALQACRARCALHSKAATHGRVHTTCTRANSN